MIYSYLKDNAFKRVVPFVTGQGVGPQGKASLYKTLMSTPPHWHLAFCVHKISFSSVPATKLLTQVASAEPGPQGHELLKTHDDTLSSAEARNGYGEEKCDVMLPW